MKEHFQLAGGSFFVFIFYRRGLLCLCVCGGGGGVYVSVPRASDSSESISHHHQTWHGERTHHVLTILNLTFTQGHKDLSHENNKCSIIAETFQAMPIKFVVMIVRLQVYIYFLPVWWPFSHTLSHSLPISLSLSRPIPPPSLSVSVAHTIDQLHNYHGLVGFVGKREEVFVFRWPNWPSCFPFAFDGVGLAPCWRPVRTGNLRHEGSINARNQ